MLFKSFFKGYKKGYKEKGYKKGLFSIIVKEVFSEGNGMVACDETTQVNTFKRQRNGVGGHTYEDIFVFFFIENIVGSGDEDDGLIYTLREGVKGFVGCIF